MYFEIVEEPTLAEKDNYLMKIESQIDAKKKLLLDKNKELKKYEKMNEFLTGVMKDYKEYYKHISEQKQQQIESMSMLKDYVNDLIISGNLSDDELKKSKAEYNEILREIGKIKNNLNEIIKSTE